MTGVPVATLYRETTNNHPAMCPKKNKNQNNCGKPKNKLNGKKTTVKCHMDLNGSKMIKDVLITIIYIYTNIYIYMYIYI